jgi:tRNA threonylcarbamoyladenosine biosynthesis protein TsaB
MRILAVDTTSAFGSLALYDGAIIEETLIHSPDGFSQILVEHVRKLLERHDWALPSIDCFAAAAGPGSFTGIRVGLTAMMGLAEAFGRPAAAVSNLQALASCGETPVRGVVVDARRGEIYGAVYDSELRIVRPEVVTSFRAWIDALPPSVTEIVSTDFGAFRSAFDRDLPVREFRAIAGAVAILASRRGGSDAELLWTDR